MSFQVSRTVLNNITLIHLIDNNHSTGITIIPEAGALLHEFMVPVNGKPFNIIENYPLDKPVKGQVTHYFRSAKLSPWVCRLAKGRYRFNEEEFQVQRMFSDGTALHGLLFDQTFNVVDEFSDDSSAAVTLKHTYSGYDAGYPFQYSCQVKYALYAEGVLEVETVITNLDNVNIPIADGWHPYFKLGGKANNWELFFESKAMLEFDEKLIPTGTFIPFNAFNQPAPIADIQLDNCFVLETTDTQPACMLRNPANNLLISFFPASGYPYLQIFIPDHRESIAIENISSAPDSFNNGIGLITLRPGHSHTFRVFYKAEVDEAQQA
ncbi:MAG: aldose 1-epimerase [Chitinophagaceae bacterium]